MTKLDLDRMFGAVSREFHAREYRGQPARVVVLRRTFDTSVDDLWSAMTTQERIGRWLTPVTGELRLGGRFQLQGNAAGEVLTCEAPRHLVVTWEFGGGTSWVEVTLAAAGERAALELQHIAHVAPDDDHWQKFGPGAVGVGWDLSLAGLEHHLATGGSAMAEGVESDPALIVFMRRAALDWGRAHHTGGEAEETARASADRTAAFYTGEG
jgi:uncharacterized protein YndB with AHSA1/START domain